MARNPRLRGLEIRRILLLAVGLVPSLGLLGCADVPRVSMRAERSRIEMWMDPATHQLRARTVLDLVASGDQVVHSGGPVAVAWLLHPDLRVTRIQTAGVGGRYGGYRLVESTDDSAPDAHEHLVVLDEPVEALTLFIDYEGALFQDVAAGEVPGQIHNLTMRAHIGDDGIYLAGGHWYPQPVVEVGTKPPLGDFLLLVDPVPGFELVAGAERHDALAEQTGRLAWQSSYPLEALVLVGGMHEVHRSEHSGVDIRLHLKRSQAQHAAGLFEAVHRYLDRYEPLIGPYPARDFTIVDNFFSSGFAFPTFTLLSSAVIDMGERAQKTHGYIDHEMLHCWWGNGVFVDPADGNWCEALASYGANYYGHVLDQDETEARRKRRNYSHFLSRIKPDRDKPLGTYGLNNGCGRSIAYQKGAAVFHMLARKMGQDVFWAAMRTLTREHVGTYVSWDDIRRICEDASGLSLERFFRQWVRSGGAPTLSVEGAYYDDSSRKLMVTLSQGEPAFDLLVPLRVTFADGVQDVSVAITAPREQVSVSVAAVPVGVEVDPDYHVFRRVPPEDLIPTTASTRRGKAFACVLPVGEVDGEYKNLQATFERKFKPAQRILRVAGEIEEGALAKRCVLVLGGAVVDPYVAAFLSAIDFPVRFSDGGFEFDGVKYDDAGHAVLCTVRHPGVTDGGVTVVFANSEAAVPSANVVPMYARSLVIFKDRRPILRRDFERRHVVPVER